MNKFKENLKVYRKSKGLNQEEFGKLFSVSESTVYRWEHGSEPEYDILIKIANFFDVSIDELLGNDKLCKK